MRPVLGETSFGSASRYVPFSLNSARCSRITPGSACLSASSSSTSASVERPVLVRFTTGSFSGGLAPTVVFSDPAPNASHVSRSGNISIAFSEALDPATVSTRTITVTDADGNAAAGSVNYAGNAVIFTPSSPLIPGTVYTVTVTSGIKDLQGHAFQGDYSWQFVTVNLM